MPQHSRGKAVCDPLHRGVALRSVAIFNQGTTMGRFMPRWAAVLLASYALQGAAASDVIFIANFAAEPPEVHDITAAHNAVRAAVGVGPLFWDERLAATAQAWANQCVDLQPLYGLIDHNNGRSVGYPWYVGENIAGTSGITLTGQLAVNIWAGELADYDYASNTCAPGKVCGHYTQIVWANSVLIGCGMSTCPALAYPNSIVCNYGPAGNIGVEWPY